MPDGALASLFADNVVWYGRETTLRQAREAREGRIAVYPMWIRFRDKAALNGYTTREAVRIHDMDALFAPDTPQSRRVCLVDVAKDRLWGATIASAVACGEKSPDVLEQTLAFADTAPDTEIFAFRRAPAPLAHGGYITLSLAPGPLLLWVTPAKYKGRLLDGYEHPAHLDALELELHPGAEYYVRAVARAPLVRVPEEAAKAEIARCRESLGGGERR